MLRHYLGWKIASAIVARLRQRKETKMLANQLQWANV
jgi:hypothetical protein